MEGQQPQNPVSPLQDNNANAIPPLPPVVDTPNINPVTTPEAPMEYTSKRYPWKIIGIIAGVVLVLLSAVVAYAYGVVPMGNPIIQAYVAHVVLSAPFLPKTPLYVLETAGTPYQNIDSFAYNVELNLDMSNVDLGQYTSSFKLGDFDGKLNGSISGIKANNPSTVVDVLPTNDSDIEVRYVNKKLYFEIISLPSSWLSSLESEGISASQINQYLGKWYFIDLSSQSTNSDAPSQTQGDQAYIYYFAKRDVLNNLTMTTESGDYHIHFTPTAAQLDEFPSDSSQKLSQEMSDVIIDIWVDSSNYDEHKISIKCNLLIPTATSVEKLPMTLSVQISNLNANIHINTPSKAQDFQTLLGGLGSSSLNQSPI